jgi:hypothetical protein
MFKVDKDFIFSTARPFVSLFGIYVVWIFAHYISAHLYVHLCVPATIVGFVLTPFLVPLPQCQALRWAIYNGGHSIVAMWAIFGVWMMSFFSPIRA